MGIIAMRVRLDFGDRSYSAAELHSKSDGKSEILRINEKEREREREREQICYKRGIDTYFRRH